MNTTIKTLSTVAALGADCKVSNGFVYVTGLEPMLQKGIEPTSVIAPVTEVLQVTTGTPSVANSTFYGISITYTNKKTGILESITMDYTSKSDATTSGTGAQDICDYFRDAINGMSEILPITASGTTTLVLTAVTGEYSSQAAFSVASYGVGVITFATGTPAVIGVGKGIFLKGGNYYDADLVDSSYYYQVIMNYANAEPTGSAMNVSNLVDCNVLYVLSTATNVDSLVGTYGTLTIALTGKSATYVAGTGTLATTTGTGALALAGGSGFGVDGILVGDVLFLTTAAYFPVISITSQTAGYSSNTTAGSSGPAAFTIVRIR